MTTIRRVVVTLLALAAIAAAGAGGIHAASPSPSVPVIGGDLEAFRTRVVVTSRSTYEVEVTMVHDDDVTITPSSFHLAPGETIELAVAGDASGRVGARMSAIDAGPGDTASVTLEVSFPDPPSPEFPWPLVVASIVIVGGFLSGFYAVMRVTRRYAIVRRVDR